MKLVQPLTIAADYSEAALEDAWSQAFKPEHYSVIVGVLVISTARVTKLNGKVPPIFINPDWNDQWMLSSLYHSVFSESAGG